MQLQSRHTRIFLFSISVDGSGKNRNICHCQAHTRSHGVTAKAGEHMAARRHCLVQVKALNAPGGAAGGAVRLHIQHHSGFAVALYQVGSHNTDDPRVVILPGHHQYTLAQGCRVRSQLGSNIIYDFAFQLLPQGVIVAQLSGARRSRFFILRQQQLQRPQGTIHSPGCVNAWA